MRTLFIWRVWDYKQRSKVTGTPPCWSFSSWSSSWPGFVYGSSASSPTPTVRTLLRVFVGLCLAAVVAYLMLAAGFPTSLLV
jgi:hypothetical protein